MRGVWRGDGGFRGIRRFRGFTRFTGFRRFTGFGVEGRLCGEQRRARPFGC
jgi:hypothetical protein